MSTELLEDNNEREIIDNEIFQDFDTDNEIKNNELVMESIDQAIEITDNILDLSEDISVANEALLVKTISNYRKQLGFENYNIATESFKSISLENTIIDTIKDVWKKIVAFFKNIIKSIKDFFKNLFDKSNRLEKQIDNLIKKSNKKDGMFKPNSITISKHDINGISTNKSGSNYLVPLRISDSTNSFLHSMQNGYGTLLSLVDVSYATLENIKDNYKHQTAISSENLSDNNFNKISDFIKRNFKASEKFPKLNIYEIEFGHTLHFIEIRINKETKSFDIEVRYDKNSFYRKEISFSKYLDGSNVYRIKTYTNEDCHKALIQAKNILTKNKETDKFLKDLEDLEKNLEKVSNTYIDGNVEKISTIRESQREMIELSRFIIKICSNTVPKVSQHVLRYIGSIVHVTSKSIA